MGFDSAQKIGSEFEPNVKIDANPLNKKVVDEAPEMVVEEPKSPEKSKGPWGNYTGLFNGVKKWLSEEENDFQGN
jgi:hypothetical protein